MENEKIENAKKAVIHLRDTLKMLESEKENPNRNALDIILEYIEQLENKVNEIKKVHILIGRGNGRTSIETMLTEQIIELKQRENKIKVFLEKGIESRHWEYYDEVSHTQYELDKQAKEILKLLKG